MGFIYIFINKINGKVYIGQTVQNAMVRYGQHLCNSRRKPYLPLHRAINKYGIDNFEFIYEECDNGELDEREIEYIKELDTLKPNGYNLDCGGNLQKSRSRETRLKISKALTGKKLSTEHRKSISFYHADVSGASNPFYGKRHTSKTKAKMSVNRRGKCTGNKNPMFGKGLSGKNNGRSRRIKLIHPDKSIEFFECCAEAARRYDLNRLCLNRVARGIRNHHKGFAVEYL